MLRVRMSREQRNTIPDRECLHPLAQRFDDTPPLVSGSASLQRIFEPGPALPYGKIRAANPASFQPYASLAWTGGPQGDRFQCHVASSAQACSTRLGRRRCRRTHGRIAIEGDAFKVGTAAVADNQLWSLSSPVLGDTVACQPVASENRRVSET